MSPSALPRARDADTRCCLALSQAARCYDRKRWAASRLQQTGSFSSSSEELLLAAVAAAAACCRRHVHAVLIHLRLPRRRCCGVHLFLVRRAAAIAGASAWRSRRCGRRGARCRRARRQRLVSVHGARAPQRRLRHRHCDGPVALRRLQQRHDLRLVATAGDVEGGVAILPGGAAARRTRRVSERRRAAAGARRRQGGRTSFLALRSAPASSSACTIAVCPLKLAFMRAV